MITGGWVFARVVTWPSVDLQLMTRFGGGGFSAIDSWMNYHRKPATRGYALKVPACDSMSTFFFFLIYYFFYL